MSQFEQENDLGRGGGEVDDETLADAWETRERLGAEGNLDDPSRGDSDPAAPDPAEADPAEPDPAEPDPAEPWAKTSSGDDEAG